MTNEMTLEDAGDAGDWNKLLAAAGRAAVEQS